jgi:hypothetical protein
MTKKETGSELPAYEKKASSEPAVKLDGVPSYAWSGAVGCNGWPTSSPLSTATTLEVKLDLK